MRLGVSLLLCSFLVASFTAIGEGSREHGVETDDISRRQGAEVLFRSLQQLLGRKLKAQGSSPERELETPEERRLQNARVPRPCGETISVMRQEEFRPLLLGIVAASVNETDDLFQIGVSLIESTVTNDILASKICSSCEEIIERYGQDVLTQGSERHGFASYCGPGKFGASATVTGLLLQPYDHKKGQVAQGSLSTSLWGKIAATNQYDIPSEQFPTNISALIPAVNSTREELENALISLVNVLGPIFATSSGAVSIVADYLGYGQSDHPKSFMVKQYYQVSSVPLFLAAKKDIEEANSCTGLSPIVSLHGFSEAGFSAVAVAVALNEMDDVTIKKVSTGGAPFRMSSVHYVTSIQNLKDGTFLPETNFVIAQFGYAYSSTNRNLANTNKTDVLSEDWKGNVIGWIEEGLSTVEVNAMLGNDTLDIIDPSIVAYGMAAADDGIIDLCLPSYESRENYPRSFCEALMDNDLTEILENATFPVTLCHSVDDTVADVQNLPDIAKNPNLTPFSFFPSEGDHIESGSTCLMASIVEFTFIGGNPIPLNTITNDRCAPTSSPTVVAPSRAPTILSIDGDTPVLGSGLASGAATGPSMVQTVWFTGATGIAAVLFLLV